MESPGGKGGQKWELKATSVKMVGFADPDSYPLQKNVTPTNFSGRSLTFDPEAISMVRYSDSGLRHLLLFINSFAREGSSMCIPPL